MKQHEETINIDKRYVGKLSRVKWGYAIQIVTNHTICDFNGEPVAVVHSELEDPPVRPVLVWARWKARKMIRRNRRRDIRKEEPWTLAGSVGAHRSLDG